MRKRIISFSIVIGVLLLLQWGSSFVFNSYFAQVLGLIGINIILAASLNLITGFTGQFSLGHAGFMALGAYGSSVLSVYCGPFLPLETMIVQQLFFVFVLVMGGLFAAVCSLLVGIPSLRLKGDYLAIVTLGFGEIIRVLVLNISFVGGARGFSGIPTSTNLFWIGLSVWLTLTSLKNMLYSPRGKAFVAVRDDEIASESLGINTTRVKVTAFVIGAFFAGLAGGLMAHFIGYLNPSSFSFLKSVEIITMVVLGGLGSLIGSVVSAVVLTSLPEFLRFLSDYRMIFYSLLLILMMIFRPQGIMGTKK